MKGRLSLSCIDMYLTLDGSLYKALSTENHMERRKTSGCLSRIIRAVTSVQANEAEREVDSAKIKDAVRPLLAFHEEAGGSDARSVKGD